MIHITLTRVPDDSHIHDDSRVDTFLVNVLSLSLSLTLRSVMMKDKGGAMVWVFDGDLGLRL